MSTVSFTGEELQRVLSLISGAKSKGASLEILSHFLLTTENGTSTFFMTNLDVSSSCTIPSESDGDIKVAIPYIRFTQLIASRKGVDKPIKIVIGKDNHGSSIVTIKQARWKAQIRTMDASEFPSENSSELDKVVVLDVDELIDSIQDTTFCTATDFSRPVLQGVHISSTENGFLSFQATDGFRLASKESTAVGSGYDCVVSSDTLKALSPFLKQTLTVSMGINKNAISFSGDGWKLRGQLISGAYPDTSPLLTIPTVTEFVVNTDDVRMSLSGAAAFKAEKINFTYKSGVLHVSMANAFGEVDDKIEVNGNGVDVEFQLNPAYVIPILSRRGELSVKTNGVAKPVFFTSENILWVVMPLQGK